MVMVIKFGEHEPIIEKTTVEREFVECKCGERIWTDEKSPITKKDIVWEKTIRCKKCGRIYSPISYFRTGQDTCYILSGFPCFWCDNTADKLYKLRPEDDEPSVCRKCLEKEIVSIPKKIKDREQALVFYKQQLGVDGITTSSGMAVKIINILEDEFRKKGMFGVVHSVSPELEKVINAIIRGEDENM
jgi:hypothetical protein